MILAGLEDHEVGTFTGNWAWMLLFGWLLQDMFFIFGGYSLVAKHFYSLLSYWYIFQQILGSKSSILWACVHVCNMSVVCELNSYLCHKSVSNHNITRMLKKRHFAFITAGIFFLLWNISRACRQKLRIPCNVQNCNLPHLHSVFNCSLESHLSFPTSYVMCFALSRLCPHACFDKSFKKTPLCVTP